MDAILISFAICVLGVMVTVLIFGLAMRPEAEEEVGTADDLSPSKEQFFMSDGGVAPGEGSTATNAVLLDLERHVRTEQQAAEAFLRGPSTDSLHAPSDSPFWH